ncbi:MAG TPA: hypothetical protein VES01_03510 [Dermatophilaceae bacterium]|nr:hypothetical protein [Dermatophilaceae bacterium]
MLRDSDQWGTSLVAKVKRRWWVLVVTGLLGALFAGWVAASTPYRASALLLLRVRAFDSTAMERATQSALEETGAPVVFDSAAKALAVTRQDLQARTTLAASTKSLVLTVQVADDDPARAAAGANAVANAAVAVSKQRRDGELARLREATTELIAERPLRGAAAETARVQKLAEGLAANQSNVLGDYGRLELLQSADSTGATRPSTSNLALVGAIAGAALGLALLLLSRGRQGRVASEKELRSLYPMADVVRPHDLPAVLALASPPYRMVAVAEHPEDLRQGGSSVADTVCSELHDAGYEVAVVSAGQAGGLAGLAGLHRANNSTVHIMSVPATPIMLSRAAADPGVLVLCAVQPKRTQIGDLDRLAPYFTERTALVLTPAQRPARAQRRDLAAAGV